MKIHLRMTSLGFEPRDCKHGETFVRGDRMNATDEGWFCDDCAEGDTMKNITEPMQQMKHASAVEKLNDLLIALKLSGMSNDLLVKPSEFGEPINESKLIEILSEVRDEIMLCREKIEIKH